MKLLGLRRLWSGAGSETRAIAIVLAVGVVLAVFVLTRSKGGGGGGGHNHGHGSGHGEGEHEDDDHGVELDDDQLAQSAIKLETAGPGTVRRTLRLRGRVSANRDRYAAIAPRFSGVVTKVAADLGQDVTKGTLLAVVESSAARSAIEVRSGTAGTIVERRAVRGAFASDREALFTVVDLASVWAELHVADKDFGAVRPGQKVIVRDTESQLTAETTVAYVSPSVDEDTQSLLVRAVIDNSQRAWRPGTFIDAEVFTDERAAAVIVRREAVQTMDERPVVFVRHEEHFEPRYVQIGHGDREVVEIAAGVKAGETYAGANSFIVKAEFQKALAGASHSH